MGDKNIEARDGKGAGDTSDTHKNLLADTGFNKYLTGNEPSNEKLTGVTSTAVGRIGMGLVEGFGNSFAAAAHDIEEELDHPKDLAKKAFTGAAFGAALRLCLPEGGAMKALTGTVMSYMFIKDAATPIVTGAIDSASATNRSEFDAATHQMGDGLGKFYVDGGIAMASGALGEGFTGAALTRTSLGRGIESFKTRTFDSDQTAIGRFFKGSERVADRTTSSIAESLIEQGQAPKIADVPLAEKLDAIGKTSKHYSAKDGEGLTGEEHPIGAGSLDRVLGTQRVVDTRGIAPEGQQIGAKKFDFEGMKQENKRFRSLSDTIDNLLAAPAEEPQIKLGDPTAPQSYRRFGIKAEDRPIPDEPVTELAGKGSEGTTGDAEGAARKGKPKGGDDTKSGDGKGDGTAKPTDNTKAPAKPVQTGDMTSDKIGSMAVSIRKATAKVTKDDMGVAQVKEDMEAPLVSTMRSGKAPLDEGHYPNSRKLLKLNHQIETVQDVQQAGPLLDHFRVALQQLEISTSGGMPQIRALNQMSRSVHTALMKRLIDQGVPIEVLRGTNSPMFGIRDVDGAGPYTIPAVPKVTDAAVVSYPREFDGLQGVHTAGVYPHELGHDLVYGDLLRFPGEQRDKILTDAVVKGAMKKAGIQDADIQVPGAPGGTMKKSEFFVQLLKAEANENTADMFGTSIDPNTGLSLAVLLGSLRKPPAETPTAPGPLETRSMYGKEMVDTDMQNTLGIEPHGIDRWRLKLAAQTLRELGNGDKAVTDYANSLDALATNTSRQGSQYVWANADEPGKFVAIPQSEWDAIIPSLVDAQFNTKLDVLKGKTLKDVSPDMPKLFARIDTLAKQLADAAVKGEDSLPNFDKSSYRIEEVYSAGLSGWMKAVSQAKDGGVKVSSDVLMQRINQLSDKLTQLYVNDMPEKALPGWKESAVSPSDVQVSAPGFLRTVGANAARFQPSLRDKFGRWTPEIGAYWGMGLLGDDLLDHKHVQDQIVKPKGP